jgi:hypothetical protein
MSFFPLFHTVHQLRFRDAELELNSSVKSNAFVIAVVRENRSVGLPEPGHQGRLGPLRILTNRSALALLIEKGEYGR